MSASRWVAWAVAACLLCSFTIGCDTDEGEHFYVIASKDTAVVGESVQLEGQSQYAGVGSCSQKHEESKQNWSGSEVAWAVSPADGASVSAAGVFVATKPGSYTVTGHPARDGAGYVEEPTTITVVEALQHKGGSDGGAEVDPDEAVSIYDNHNAGGVVNGGTPPTFQLDRPAVVTFLETYHYNDGSGTGAPGEVGLKSSDGTVYGPWKAEGVPGQGNVPNAYWRAYPMVELPAGTYTVTDTDHATWSQNGGSGGVGMVRLSGVYTE